jgi:S-adenosylmethionine:tRNA ribosyltransferase-isomerase
VKLADFDYDLPAELVAQEPCERRDAARLLVHAIGPDRTEHRSVRDLVELLRPEDLLVVNDTRVLPGRLFGRRASGGRVELLLLEPLDDAPGAPWSALVNPARKLHPGEVIALEDGELTLRFLERGVEPGGRPAPTWSVELFDAAGGPVDVPAALERHGHVPLPPYIERAADDPADRARYQTVYAEVPGAVAAPTAGLHFTPELLEALAARGVRRATVTLHVGLGTFRPIDVEDVEAHEMHAERFTLPPETARAVEETRKRGGRVVAVGTTSVRVLESCATPDGGVLPDSGDTRLFLRPGSPFRVVDALLTNFHLPRSSLLVLVSAFAGRERTLRLYAEAVAERYRFYSYGDAMLLTDRPG